MGPCKNWSRPAKTWQLKTRDWNLCIGHRKLKFCEFEWVHSSEEQGQGWSELVSSCTSYIQRAVLKSVKHCWWLAKNCPNYSTAWFHFLYKGYETVCKEACQSLLKMRYNNLNTCLAVQADSDSVSFVFTAANSPSHSAFSISICSIAVVRSLTSPSKASFFAVISANSCFSLSWLCLHIDKQH